MKETAALWRQRQHVSPVLWDLSIKLHVLSYTNTVMFKVRLHTGSNQKCERAAGRMWPAFACLWAPSCTPSFEIHSHVLTALQRKPAHERECQHPYTRPCSLALKNIWLRKCVFVMNNKPYFEEQKSCRVWGAMQSVMDGEGYVLLSASNTQHSTGVLLLEVWLSPVPAVVDRW